MYVMSIIAGVFSMFGLDTVMEMKRSTNTKFTYNTNLAKATIVFSADLLFYCDFQRGVGWTRSLKLFTLQWANLFNFDRVLFHIKASILLILQSSQQFV